MFVFLSMLLNEFMFVLEVVYGMFCIGFICCCRVFGCCGICLELVDGWDMVLLLRVCFMKEKGLCLEVEDNMLLLVVEGD